MTTYAFDDAISTTLASITGGLLAAGSTGVLADLVTNGSGQAENSNNYSTVGIYKAGSNESEIVIPASQIFGSEYAAAIIACDGATQGYKAYLSGLQNTTEYNRVYLERDDISFATLLFATPIDMTDGDVTLNLALSGSDVIVTVSQGGSLFEAFTTNDPAVLAKTGAGFLIKRDGAVVQVESWNDHIAGDETAPVLSTPTGTKTGSTTANGTVSTDEGNGTLYYFASANASDTASTIKTNGSSQAVSATGSQTVSFTGLTPSTNYYAHYVHEDAAGNQSNIVSSAQFTTDAPSFGIDSISDSTPDAGSTTTFLFSNEGGSVTASCSAGALSGLYSSGQFVLDIPEPALFGDKTLSYETSVTVTLSDGTNTDAVSIEIQVPSGELFAEITELDADGIYANDAGLSVGDFAHFKNITGDIVIDPATGLYAASPSSNVSFDYALYDVTDNTWSDNYQTNSYTAETTPPVITLRGADPLVWVQGVAWVDPGADVIDNVDAARIISADAPPNINTVGSQSINYNAVDVAGNAAIEVSRAVNVVAGDSTPTQFNFTDVNNADLNTLYENTQSISDVDAGQTVTAIGGEVSNDNGATWSSSVQMVTGQTLVKASITTSSTNSLEHSQEVTVNGVSDTFSVTTKALVTRTFSIGSSDPVVDDQGSNEYYIFPIWELWSAAPEEGGTLIDSGTSFAIANGIGSISTSSALPSTTYLLIARDAGNLPANYMRTEGQVS